MSEWQPIETAPKDGTEILVFSATDRPRVSVAQWIFGDDYELFVYSDEALRDISPQGPEPTHWMPLPDPPKG